MDTTVRCLGKQTRAAPQRERCVTMTRWAALCELAKRDPQGAARTFLAEADGDSALRLMDAALWREEGLADFELNGAPVLIAGRWGKFWFAPDSYSKVLLPPAPRVPPRGLVALARAVVDRMVN